MSLIVPAVGQILALQKILNLSLSLKLYSNDYTPVNGSTAGNFTEVAGGGYSAKTLAYGNWTMTSGNPSYASCVHQDFIFTGTTDAPGVIYGYYIVSGSTVYWAERFDAPYSPITPVASTFLRITPRIQA